MSTTVKILIGFALALAGCGGEPAAEDNVRETALKGAQALLSDHPERACQYMLDREKCVGTAVLLKGMDTEAIAGYPDDWEDRLADATIKIDGETATISDFNGDGQPGVYVRRGGRWLADNR